MPDFTDMERAGGNVMWKTAIVMALIVSRLAEAASAVEELALEPCKDTGMSSRVTHVVCYANGGREGLSGGIQDGVVSLESDSQARPPRRDTRQVTALQHPCTAPSPGSAQCT